MNGDTTLRELADDLRWVGASEARIRRGFDSGAGRGRWSVHLTLAAGSTLSASAEQLCDAVSQALKLADPDTF
jgi:hypothetical protein